MLYPSTSSHAHYISKGMKFCHFALQELEEIAQLFPVFLKAVNE